TYQLAPLKAPYATLPPALVGGPSTPDVGQALGVTTGTSCDTPANEAKAAELENGLPDDYLKYLLTGPFLITSPKHPYDAHDGSAALRFFERVQALERNAAAATAQNAAGCA